MSTDTIDSLSPDELETILVIAKNRQSGRITEWEIRELVAAYQANASLRQEVETLREALKGAREQFAAIQSYGFFKVECKERIAKIDRALLLKDET